jgi:S-adenosylmethionine decarboxylase proenzyme
MALLEAAEKVGATVIDHTFHQFSPHGVTGVVAIAESHLCIHTWPEYGYAAVDVFTCGESFNPRVAAQHLIGRLNAGDSSMVEVKRGVLPQLDGVVEAVVA